MRRKRDFKPVNKPCWFCESNETPDYKDYETLKNYLSARGSILGKDRTGVCSKHQRQLSAAIKRARHLALLPFVAKVKA